MVTKPDDSASVKTDRRQMLILAAFETIAERGYEGLRVRDVAFQVGINGATLHHYFPTKEVLIQSVLEYCHGRLDTIYRDLTGTPAEQMRQVLERLHMMMRTEPGIFIVLVETNLRAQHGLALNYVMQQEAKWQNQLASILAAGVEQRLWGQVVDPGAMASIIITMVEGASLWLVARPDKADQVIAHIKSWLALS